jgi:chromosome partitioning protein
MARKSAIFNSKGGTGKSTINANGAYCLSYLGRKTLIIDLDDQKDVAKFLGIKTLNKDENGNNLTIFNLFDYRYPAKVEDIIVRDVRPNLDYIGNEFMDMLRKDVNRADDLKTFFSDKLEKLENEYDEIMIDCSGDSSDLNKAIMHYVDQIIVPVQLEFASVIGVARVFSFLEDCNIHKTKVRHVIPNMYMNNNDSKDMLDALHLFFKDPEYDFVNVTPPISRRVDLTRASSKGLTVFEYDDEVAEQFITAFKSVVSTDE